MEITDGRHSEVVKEVRRGTAEVREVNIGALITRERRRSLLAISSFRWPLLWWRGGSRMGWRRLECGLGNRVAMVETWVYVKGDRLRMLHGAPSGALRRHVYRSQGVKNLLRVSDGVGPRHADGVCSAAIVKAALAGEYEAVKIYFTHPVDLAKDFREFAEGDVYIVDVAVDEGAADEVRRAFRGYRGRVVYIDHHPLSVDLPGVEVVHEMGSSASELTYRHLGGKLPRLYSRVGLYGAIWDYLDHTEWVEETLEAWDRRIVYFEAGVLMQGLERARKDHEFKRAVVDHLARNSPPSAMERLVKLAEEQARVNEALVGWVARNVSLHGAVAVVVNPRACREPG